MEYDGGGYIPQTGANETRDHDPPLTLDAEEDHMLFYFLDEVNTDNTSTQHNQTNSTSYLKLPAIVSQDNLSIPSTRANVTSTTTNLAFPTSHVSRNPCTTALRFYAPNTSNHYSNVVPRAAPLDSSSSLSSSMTAIMASGGSILQSHPQLQQTQNSYAPQNPPPKTIFSISPATNMGIPQEMMMLTPLPRHNIDVERQHLAWSSHVKPQVQTIVPSVFGHIAPKSIAPMSSTYGNTHPRQTKAKERKACRLARNRELARQSRRRKKEQLANLSGQVNQLCSNLDQERRRLFSELEPKLQELRQKKIEKLGRAKDDSQRLELIRDILNQLATNCTIRKETASFQYDSLKQLLLPKYQIFMLWLTLQDEGFFTAGKHEHAKTEGINNRLSSKQIGEELTNKWKNNNKKLQRNSMEIFDDMNTLTTLTARADEPSRLWPLFSFDMSISVDQEERLMHFHKRVQDTPELKKDCCEMSDTIKLITKMKKGILSQCRSTHGRSEHLLMDILEPEQSAKFLRWYQMNDHQIRENMSKKQGHPQTNDIPTKEGSVSDVYRHINENLRLPENFEEDWPMLKLDDDFW